MSNIAIRPILCFVLAMLSVAALSADTADIALPEAPLDKIWPALSEARFGDLDAMVERGEIRVLTTFTLGSYFIDRGEQRGVVYELSQILEKYAHDKLGKKARILKVTIIPVRRDQLIPFLISGQVRPNASCSPT